MANISNFWWQAGKEHPMKGKPSPNKGRKNKVKNRKGKYKSCLHCKKEFYATGSNEVCCSRKCSLDSGHRGKRISKAKGDKTGWKTTKSQRIRQSAEYKEWRKKVFERDDYTCQLCGKRGIELNADHIKPFAFFPEERFNVSNGRTLCKVCHKKTDTYMHKLLTRNSKGQFQINKQYLEKFI